MTVPTPTQTEGPSGDTSREQAVSAEPAPPPAATRKPGFFSLRVTRASLLRLAILFASILACGIYGYFAMVRMPGKSFTGPLPPLTPAQTTLAAQLRTDVEFLASDLGKRSTFHPREMAAAARYIIKQLNEAGYPDPEEVPVERNARVPNVIVEIPGTTRAKEIVIIGAHYDSYQGTPGADDNASGVAATLALARHFVNKPQARTLRFALFVNEEPPSFQTSDMGSWVYARICRARNDNVVAMISLETIGFYTDEIGYQQYPPLVGNFYPAEGNFIAFVGNHGSRALVRRAIGSFRASARFPSEGAALPAAIKGVGWSDHWAFWQEGYPAIMVTDTAPFRNPHYHIESDRPATLNFEHMARVVEGLTAVATDLAGK